MYLYAFAVGEDRGLKIQKSQPHYGHSALKTKTYRKKYETQKFH